MKGRLSPGTAGRILPGRATHSGPDFAVCAPRCASPRGDSLPRAGRESGRARVLALGPCDASPSPSRSSSPTPPSRPTPEGRPSPAFGSCTARRRRRRSRATRSSSTSTRRAFTRPPPAAQHRSTARWLATVRSVPPDGWFTTPWPCTNVVEGLECTRSARQTASSRAPSPPANGATSGPASRAPSGDDGEAGLGTPRRLRASPRARAAHVACPLSSGRTRNRAPRTITWRTGGSRR